MVLAVIHRMRRVVIISDLHIGGKCKPMLGHPELLVSFLDQLSEYAAAAQETVEFVINGDFVDFLAIEPFAAWTPDEWECIAKLKQAFDQSPLVFDALSRCISKVGRFTLLLGNHDIESALPRVYRDLLARLGTNPHRCLFINDNQAYCFGDLLVEHGNRYDSWNAIDYDGFRRVLSQASRFEPLGELGICPGSKMVEGLVNPLKTDYPFVELLKPETKVLPLLLTALEPSLKHDVRRLYRVFRLWSDQWLRTRTWRPKLGAGGEELIADPGVAAGLPSDVQAEFSEELAVSEDGEELASLTEVWRGVRQKLRPEGIASKVRSNEQVSDDQLARIQLSFERALQGDRTFDDDGPDGPYLEAARRLSSEAGGDGRRPRIVVMGHTHLIRQIDLGHGRWYLNTGTWADLIKVPSACLDKTCEGRAELGRWLRQLVLDVDSLRFADPAYADVCLDGEGSLCQPANRPFIRRFGSEPFAA